MCTCCVRFVVGDGKKKFKNVCCSVIIHFGDEVLATFDDQINTIYKENAYVIVVM